MPFPIFDRSRLKLEPLAERVHDMTLAEKTDRILRIVDGKMVCEMRRKDGGFVTVDNCEAELDGKD